MSNLKGKGFFDRKLDFTKKSKMTLKKYGECPIKQIFITRRPINGMIEKALNLSSLGKWKKLRKEYYYDTLFHLAIIFQVDCNGKNTLIKGEKNSTVDIIDDIDFHNNTEIYNIKYKPYTLNINDFIYDTLERIGKNDFFIYDPFAKNCQFFIRHLLKTHNLYNDEIEKWLFQNISEIVNNLPWFSKWFAKSITDIDAWKKIKFGGNNDFHIMPDGKKMKGKSHGGNNYNNDRELELILNMVYKMLK